MFNLEMAFYKAKHTSLNGNHMRHSRTVEHVCRQHWAQQKSAFQTTEPAGSLKLPVLQQLNLKLQSRREQLAKVKEWPGSCGQHGALSAGFAWLRAPQWGNQEPQEWVTRLFPATMGGTEFSIQFLKFFGSPQGSTQVEGGSPLQGWPKVLEHNEVSKQGYHGTPASGSRLLLKARCFAE